MILATSAIILTLLGLAVASGFLILRQSLADVSQFHNALQARYSAEAGLYHAFSLISPGTGFQRLRAGTGGVLPGGPGPVASAGGGAVEFPWAPHNYVVTVEAAPPPTAASPAASHPEERVRLRSQAEWVRGSRRAVVGLVGRSPAPYLFAPLTVSGIPALEIEGPGPELAWPSGSQFAALAATSEAALTSARAVLADSAASAALSSTLQVSPIDLAEWIADSNGPIVAAHELATPLGSPVSPEAKLVLPGEASSLTGYGLVASTGNLTVTGPLDFRGVILVRGTLRLSGSPCAVQGAVVAERVVFEAPCHLEISASFLDIADRALRLPRQAVLLSLQDAESAS